MSNKAKFNKILKKVERDYPEYSRSKQRNMANGILGKLKR